MLVRVCACVRAICSCHVTSGNSAHSDVCRALRCRLVRDSDDTGNSQWWLIERDGQQGYIPSSFLELWQPMGLMGAEPSVAATGESDM